MDIGLEMFDAGNTHIGIGCGASSDLHDADGASPAPLRLVQVRFLVALGSEQQVGEAVLVAVLPEELHHRAKLSQVLLRRRVGDVSRIPPVPLVQDIPEGRALCVCPGERIEALLQFGTLLPDGPGNRPSSGESDGRVHRHAVIDLAPERRDVIVDDRCRDQAGVHHVEDVLVLELLVGLPYLDWPRSGLRERVVHPSH
jgi:hypothetical protein